MTCVPDAYLDRARSWLDRLEAMEIARGAITLASARAVVARKSQVAAGTLENIRNQRLKTIGAHVFDRLAACVERGIKREIEALEHELEMARSSALGARDVEISQVVEGIEKLRALIAERGGCS